MSFIADYRRRRRGIFGQVSGGSVLSEEMPHNAPPLSEATVSGLRLAALHRNGQGLLTTALALVGLAAADSAGDWQRLWLATGELDWQTAQTIDDGGFLLPAAAWEGVPLSADLVRAMDLSLILSAQGALGSVPPALLALAIVADGGGGGPRWLTSGKTSAEDLVDLIQADILGTTLGSPDDILSRAHQRPHPEHLPAQAHDQRPRPGGVPASAVQDVDVFVQLLGNPAARSVLANLGVTSERVTDLADRVRRLGVRNPPPDADPLEMLAALAREPSTGLRRMLNIVGVDPAQLAFAVARFQPGGQLPAQPLVPVRIATRIRRLVGLGLAVMLAVICLPRPTPLYVLFAVLPLVAFPRFPTAAGFAAWVPMAALLPDWAAQTLFALPITDWLLGRWARRVVQRVAGQPATVGGSRRLVRIFTGARQTEGWLGKAQYRWRVYRLDRQLRRAPPVTPAAPPAPAAAAPAMVPEAVAHPDALSTRRRIRSLTRRTWAWRAVSAVLVASAFAVVASSPSWFRPLPRPVTPPYNVPAIAGQMVTTPEVARLAGRRVVPIENGPPDDQLHTSSGALARDLVEGGEVSSWHRRWISADQALAIDVLVVQYRDTRLARPLCDPDRPFAIARAKAAGLTGAAGQTEGACAEGMAGRTRVTLRLANYGNVPDSTLTAVLRDLTQQQIAKALPEPAPGPRPAYSYTAAAAQRLIYLSLLLVFVVNGASILLDRALWVRFRRRLQWWRPRRAAALPLVSIEPLSKYGLAVSQSLVFARLTAYLGTLRIGEALHLQYGWTYVALVVVFVLLQGLELRVRGLGIRRPVQSFSGWGRAGALAAIALTAVIVGIAATGVVPRGVALISAGTNPGGSDFFAARTGLILLAGAQVLVLFALAPFTIARRLAMARLRNQALPDLSPRVLLLRSFTDDWRKVRSRNLNRASMVERLCLRRRERFEEVIAANLGAYGPVEGVAEPGTLPPALGAVRREYSEEHWKSGVQNLLLGARLVCVTLGRTESLRWEIDQLRLLNVLGKVVFVLPPLPAKEARLRLRVLAEKLGMPWSAVDAGPGRTVLAVVFPARRDGEPLLVVGGGPDDVAYDSALQTAIALIEPDSPATAEVRALIEAAAARPAPGTASPMTPEPPLVVWARGRRRFVSAGT